MKAIIKVLLVTLCVATTVTCIAQNKVKLGIEMDSSHSMLLGNAIDDAGAKMFWNPNKAIFLVGSGNGFGEAKWDIDSIGQFATSFGIANKPYGDGAMMWGIGNTISSETLWSTSFGQDNLIGEGSENSTVWGTGNSIRGTNGTAWGTSNNVNADYGTVWGQSNSTFNDYCTIWGQLNLALNTHATVGGYGNKAAGKYSTALGLGLLTHGAANTTVGAYNDTTLIVLEDHDNITSDTPLFVVGNGTSMVNRSNALSIFASGFTKIGNGAAAADLHIKQSTSENAPSSSGIRLENKSTTDYWQIYSTDAGLSFGSGDNRIAYIDPDGNLVSQANFDGDPIGFVKSNNRSAEIIEKISFVKDKDKTIGNKLGIHALQLLSLFPDLIVYDESGHPFGIDQNQLMAHVISALQKEISTNRTHQELLEKQGAEIARLKEIVAKR